MLSPLMAMVIMCQIVQEGFSDLVPSSSTSASTNIGNVYSCSNFFYRIQFVKLDSKTTNDTFWCECYVVTAEKDHDETECKCCGKELVKIPADLNSTLDKLIIFEADIKVIQKAAFQSYKSTLKDIHLLNLPLLSTIEEGAFSNIPNLRTIYISHVPLIVSTPGLFLGVTSTKLKALRIIHTGLEEVPDLYHIPSKNTINLLDLDHNQIGRLPSNSIEINAAQVTLNFNRIHSVENYAFNGSEIAKLHIRGNSKLSQLEMNAFAGLKSLRELDLSETAIESLPVTGLENLEELRIEKTPTMKTIPSIYDLANLKVAKLTHPFHCCAFKYPEQHNPGRHAKHEEKIRSLCEKGGFSIDTGQAKGKINSKSKRNVLMETTEGFVDTWSAPLQDVASEQVGYENMPKEHLIRRKIDPADMQTPIRGRTIDHEAARPSYEESADDIGFFHNESTPIGKNASVNAFCGHITFRIPSVKCTPEPNALNPCEDIMGSMWLRISVWFVVVLAVLGNSAVILVVVFSSCDFTQPAPERNRVCRFLICNLAIADFCLGLYLLLIASMDLHSVGSYFNFAFNWQYGWGCQVAGFLTVFASHLSIFTLTLITIERWFAITYAIYLTRRIRLGMAAKTMVFGWLYSIFIATLPLLGVSNYSSTSICLPMEVNRLADQAYLYLILLINGLAFALIAFCYAQIYLSLGYETRRTCTMGEMSIAKRMAILVFTDFATWAPIAFFGLTALAGYPLIGVPRSKILLVFFYPLNACANPYLYALTTAQYRKDLMDLCGRIGCCKREGSQFVTNTTLPSNISNHQQQNALLVKANGVKQKSIRDTYV